MATGHHAALSARVGPGKSVAVVGDGAVGLCGVIAARRLGAEQIIILGHHEDRIALARDFGATDVVSERGDEAVQRVRELTDGLGAHSVLECVGHEESTITALHSARPGGAVGRVGVPQEASISEGESTFFDNVTISGGPAPARAYMEELLPDVLEGRIEPGRVFDRVGSLDGCAGRLPCDERPRGDQGHDRALTLDGASDIDHGRSHADHQELDRDHAWTVRVVHRLGLHRRSRGAIRRLAREREQRSFHTGRANGVAHPPQRTDGLRARRHRARAVPRGPDRGSYGRVTASSSSRAKTTGTARPRTAS